MDFAHKRHPVTGGLRPPDPLAEFWTFFFIVQKSSFFIQKTYFLTKNVDFMS